MPRPLHLALVQMNPGPDLADALRRGEEHLRRAARDGARLVIFPELAFTPFWPQKPATGDPARLAEPIPGPTTERFAALARELGVAVVLNLFERTSDGRTYDASPVIAPDGRLVGVTRMTHVLEAPLCHETGYYHPGPGDALVHDLGVCRLGVAICYDRHFPEYTRRLALLGAELVVVPQAGTVGEWPEGLFEAELRVTAFHNGYAMALCNRVGREELVEFEGGSFVALPDGSVPARASKGAEEILHVTVDLDALDGCDARRHFLADRRPALYRSWDDDAAR